MSFDDGSNGSRNIFTINKDGLIETSNTTSEALRDQLPLRLVDGELRVLKRYRGAGGIGRGT